MSSPNRRGQAPPPALIGPKTRIEAAAGIVIDTSTPNVIRLSIRETEDVVLCPDEVSHPLTIVARYSFDADSLHVIVDGSNWTRGQHYDIEADNQTVRFTHIPAPGNVIKLRYRY